MICSSSLTNILGSFFFTASFVIKTWVLREVAGPKKLYFYAQVNLAWSFWYTHCCVMTLTQSKVWEVTVL